MEHGEYLPGMWLFENEGQWGLMIQPGHLDKSVLLWLPGKPTPQPDPDSTHDNDAITKADEKWLDAVCGWWEKVSLVPEQGWFLVDACEKAGWRHDRPPTLSVWLIDYLGRKLAAEIANV